MACSLTQHRCGRLCERTPAQAQAWLDGLDCLEALCTSVGGSTAAIEQAVRAEAARQQRQHSEKLQETQERVRRLDKELQRAQQEAAVAELRLREVADAAADARTRHASEVAAAERRGQDRAAGQAAAELKRLEEAIEKLKEEQKDEAERHDASLKRAEAARRREARLAEEAAERHRETVEYLTGELNEQRRATKSSTLRGRLAELEVQAFCERVGEGRVHDVSRDGRKADLLVEFPNKLAVKLEVKKVEHYDAKFEDAAFACLDDLGEDHGVRIVAVVVVNTHPTAKPARAQAEELAAHIHAYEARGGVSGYYLSGGPELWQPALRAVLQMANKLPPDAPEPDDDWEAVLQHREALSKSLDEFRQFLEDEEEHLQKDERAVKRRLAAVRAKLKEVKVFIGEQSVEQQAQQKVLAEAARIVREQGGWARWSTLKAWMDVPSMHAQIKRFWPRHFARFVEEVRDCPEPPCKRQREGSH